MDLQILMLLWLGIGAMTGAVAGILLGPNRRARYLPYVAAGLTGSIFCFAVRGAFGAEHRQLGEIFSLVAAPVFAVAFIGLAHRFRVRQTWQH